MKLLSCFLAALLTLSSFTSAEEAKSKANKIYVTQEEIQISEAGICVNLDAGAFRVKNLRSDKHGLYVLNSELSVIEKKYYWCRYCKILFSTKRDFNKHKKWDCENDRYGRGRNDSGTRHNLTRPIGGRLVDGPPMIGQ